MAENVLDSTKGVESDAVTLLRNGFHAAAGGTDDTDDATTDTMVLKLQGELDMATAPGLGRTLHTALDAGPSTLALDLRDLTFVDSTGIRVLITAGRRAGTEGCSFVLRAPCRSVRKALLLTGVDRLMAIEPEESTPALT